MPRITRKRPPKHILIPDTNILWHEKKDVCASPEFSKFWDDYGAKYEIELVLPDVVKGELLYQHTSSALTTLDRINTQFDNLSSYVSKNYKHRVNSKRVRDDVRAKFDSWILSLSAEVVETPVGQIDWGRIVQDAIWRRPPFTEDKDKKNEKGFRDALILETVCFVADKRQDTDIAFVSNDGTLIAAAKDRLKNKKQCSFYETLDELSSFLRLMDEELTNEFVQAIQKRARAKFHTEKDPSCLIYREKIIDKIRDQYAHEFASPVPMRSLGQALSGGLFSVKENWEGYGEEGIWIRAPSFVELQGESDFMWDSRVTFVQLFRYSGPGGGGLLGGMTVPGQENLRKLEFRVIWKAQVGKDARFRKMELVDILLAEKKFEPATEKEKERYGVEPITE
ncbi:MAG: DUF4935 domain-containing protein [Proteobacteria bacterium]|nr:DUF4935 domain-containing protein [Pseudomonadota bacterium]